MQTLSSPHREELLARAYEHALCSAFAHGSALTNFQFVLPRQDDVVTLADGKRGLRGDAESLGYETQERALHRAFLLEEIPFRVPDAFADDMETILEVHRADLEEIAKGLIRDARNHHTALVSPEIFRAFSRASIAFHEALLTVTGALLSLHKSEHAANLIHGMILPDGSRSISLFEHFLQAEDTLSLAVRRLRHSHLVHVIETGARSQRTNFLTHGRELGIEPAFFAYHLERG